MTILYIYIYRRTVIKVLFFFHEQTNHFVLPAVMETRNDFNAHQFLHGGKLMPGVSMTSASVRSRFRVSKFLTIERKTFFSPSPSPSPPKQGR